MEPKFNYYFDRNRSPLHFTLLIESTKKKKRNLVETLLQQTLKLGYSIMI
jgi:hypothetical protein